jgi:hypothetical protein
MQCLFACPPKTDLVELQAVCKGGGGDDKGDSDFGGSCVANYTPCGIGGCEKSCALSGGGGGERQVPERQRSIHRVHQGRNCAAPRRHCNMLRASFANRTW